MLIILIYYHKIIYFIYLGIFYERADFTARIIDVKYYILLPSSSYVGTQVDNFQWSIMLRSFSAYRGFKWAYGNSQIDYKKIIDFFADKIKTIAIAIVVLIFSFEEMRVFLFLII